MDKFILDAKQERLISLHTNLYLFVEVNSLLKVLMEREQEPHIVNLTMFLVIHQDKKCYISYHLGNTLLNIID